MDYVAYGDRSGRSYGGTAMTDKFHTSNISDHVEISYRVGQRFNSKLVGRFFDITDQEERDEFAIWLVDLLDRLGIEWSLK